MRFEKGGKKFGGFEYMTITSKNTRFTIYTTESDVNERLCAVVTNPITH